MRRTTFTAAAISLLLFFAPSLFAGDEWKPAKNSNGIQTYTRNVAGQDLDEFKGITMVNAPIEVITEILMDLENYDKWFGNCVKQRVIKSFAKMDNILYHVQKVPVITNRDVVVRGTMTADFVKGKAVLDMNAIKSNQMKDSGLVRMPKLSGKFILTRTSPTTTKVFFSINANPGGSVPAWLANSVVKEQPYKTLKGLKKMAKRDIYFEKASTAYNKKFTR